MGEDSYRQMVKVALIGAGNLATQLGVALKEHGHDVVQVFSRTDVSAKLLAQKLSAESITDIKQLSLDADLYIYAVKDSCLSELISQSPRVNGLSVHTAGSMNTDLFQPYTERYGNLYPLQTFSKEKSVDFTHIPIYIEASQPKDEELLTSLASTLSQRVVKANSEQRRRIHLAAVFACNFTNHCYAIAEKLLGEHGVEFKDLLPLIEETTQKLHHLSPLKAQTGPAVRNDCNVQSAHLSMLTDNETKAIYELMSKSIYNYNKTKAKASPQSPPKATHYTPFFPKE